LDIKGQIGPNTIVVGDFNTLLLSRYKSSRPRKINKETLEINCTMDQMGLTDTCRIVHLTAAECTFFSAIHKTFSKINHILGHKTHLNKYNKND
jgi:hypothetical protein